MSCRLIRADGQVRPPSVVEPTDRVTDVLDLLGEKVRLTDIVGSERGSDPAVPLMGLLVDAAREPKKPMPDAATPRSGTP